MFSEFSDTIKGFECVNLSLRYMVRAACFWRRSNKVRFVFVVLPHVIFQDMSVV